ncbi:hypothetical protein EMWEY_00007460 [Eimeria maxima]|uniref:Uncharacterized protein n=1 Tax=Eimeria maxima TaxID=5804 RepID=U6ME07_EIMMA|nr:hypothetical protein EMWEY_00007460 [Eimeria maxima]CDJ60674.1 hypothetical protein EMWEY_00007460 [Eimeria maxima]
MVMNYKEVNALTIAPDFPLTPISTILEMLGGATYFSSPDLESGYHKIRMAREDQWKTSFRPVIGLFEYKVIPVGLKGAPAKFQANSQLLSTTATRPRDYAAVARPLVDLTRKGVPFRWTEAHTQAVRQLRQKLIDYTTLQIPDTVKPLSLFTDASGFALGAVLEQEGRPIGFLSQTMSPAHMKCYIYNHGFLALVTALDKWAHLLRASKGTA